MRKKLSILCSLLLSAALLLPMAVMPVFADEQDTGSYAAPEAPSVTYNMNMDWKFRKAVDGSKGLIDSAAAIKQGNLNFYDIGYDDKDWESVSLPHPVNASDSFDGVIRNSGEGGIYRGFMFYRKHVTVPASDAGKKMFLEFESVRNSIYLYVNGKMVGYYEAGVVATGYDITDYVKFGEDNVIAVATDNASNRDRGDAFVTQETINDGTHTPGDLSGSGYEWNTNEFNETQGGISGNVNLYAKGKIYQTLPLYNNLKTTGNYIYASDFDLRDPNDSKATVTVKAEIRNETAADKDLTLQVDVVGMDGKLAGSFTQTGKAVKATDPDAHFESLVPSDAYEADPAPTNADTIDVSYITASKAMDHLRLWSPDDPYLYTVYTILKDGDTVIDVQEKQTGFREVIYDYDGSNGGFKINGEPIFLKGYSQRSTNEWAAIGVAPDWLSDYDMELVRESNANFIRWMHVAPKPATIRSTDKYGVVSVCPAGDKEKYEAGRMWDQRMEAMRSAILYYRNSPSVVFWEAGNGDIPAENMQEMTDIKKLLDPNGYRFMGCRTISSEEQVKAAEYIGTMLYRNAAPAQEAMKKLGKYIPIMETEHSRGESPRRVWDDFSPYFAISKTEAYDPEKDGTMYDYMTYYTTGSEGASAGVIDTWDHTQESLIVNRNIPDYANFYNSRVNGGPGGSYTVGNTTYTGINQYVAEALMNWADSNQHGRQAITENSRSSGKVDPVRIKKGTFYAIQAAQSDKPAVKIIGHWNYPKKTADNYWYYEKKKSGDHWVNDVKKQRDPENKTVYVIGSAGLSKVELYVNDALKGTSTSPTSNFIFSFPNIDVTESGKVSVKAYNAQNQVVAEDEIETTGEPAKILLEPHTGPKGFLADGSDIMYFDVKVVDSEGRVCPLSYDKIQLKISGEAVLMGGYNSGAYANTYNPASKEATIYAENGLNRVFLKSTRTDGNFTLSANFVGKAPVEFSSNTLPVEITGGLTTVKQQAKVPGEKEPEIKETVRAMKPLAAVFTAIFGEGGNTRIVKDQEIELDEYTTTVNGTNVTVNEKAVKSGGVVFIDLISVLDALKTAGADLTYTYDSTVAEPVLTIQYDNKTYMLKKEYTFTDVTTDGITSSEGPMNGAPYITQGGTFMADSETLFGAMRGVTFDIDEANKVYAITYTAQ